MTVDKIQEALASTVLGVSNVAWNISMSYAEWDNCEVEFCHRMCDRECHTYPAVLSSFEHSL